MANSFAQIDVSGVDSLLQKMERYGEGAGQTIQEYLKDEGFQRIGAHISNLIHASGRHWKGKPTSAASASYKTVFTGDLSGLTLTVRSGKSKYGYLYFPDDGSNTVHHAGNQQFMLQGADNATSEMVGEMVERLVAAFEEA